MSTVKENLKYLKTYYRPNQHVTVTIWSGVDVEEVAKRLGFTLTQTEVDNILDTMENNQDFCCGINWDTIECYIRDTMDKRRAAKL